MNNFLNNFFILFSNITVSNVLNFFLTFFNLYTLKNSITLYNYNLKPFIKLNISNIQTTRDIIANDRFLLITYKIKNVGEFPINNVSIEFFTTINGKNFDNFNKKILLDLLIKNEEIQGETFVYFDKENLIRAIKFHLSSLEEGIVSSTYNNFSFKCLIKFENIDNKIYLKEYTFNIPIELAGRFIGEKIRVLQYGESNFLYEINKIILKKIK